MIYQYIIKFNINIISAIYIYILKDFRNDHVRTDTPTYHVCQSSHVVKMQSLLHKVFRSRYFSPYCHYREFVLSHDTSAPAVAGVALGGGGAHGHPGNIKHGGFLSASRNNVNTRK